MLMLSRLYNYSLDKYFAPLTESILQEDSSPEVSFDLQVGNGDTIQIMADTIKELLFAFAYIGVLVMYIFVDVAYR